VVDQGDELSQAQRTIALSTPDTPLGCFEEIRLRSGQRAFTPKSAHYYSMVANSYWMTNFSITKAAKVTVRHRLSATLPLTELTGDLWTLPCSLKKSKRG
jgi:hypothetical protein